MKVKQTKYLTHYQKIKDCILYLIVFIITVPSLSFILGLGYKNELNVYIAGKICLKWSAIILPPLILLITLKAFFYSDYVLFDENSILYFRHVFSKKRYEIEFAEINEVLISAEWKLDGKIIYGLKIFIFRNSGQTIIYEASISLIMRLYEHIDEAKIKFTTWDYVIDDSDLNNFKITQKFESFTLNDYYNMGDKVLSEHERQILCRYYCKLSNKDIRDGNAILNKFK